MIRKRSFVRLYAASAAVLCLAGSAGPAGSQGNAPQQALPQQAGPLPAWRNRLLGVYDEETGLPVEGAQVLDVLGGWSAMTTSTGTVSLAFMDSGGTFIRVRKVGYVPFTFLAVLTAADSTPITIIINKMGTLLPRIVATARGNTAIRGSADTVQKLDLNGYYDRRQSTGAPSSAFLSGEKLERLNHLSDVIFITGRDICSNNIYIDGVRAVLPTGGSSLNQGIDLLLSPDMVSAIELYRTSEIPPQYNPTRSGGNALGAAPDKACATLIWTK